MRRFWKGYAVVAAVLLEWAAAAGGGPGTTIGARIGHMVGAALLIGVVAWIVIAMKRSNRKEQDFIRTAPPGTEKFVTDVAWRVAKAVQDYTAHDWELVDQSSAKSFGTKLQITARFRKMGSTP